MEENSYWQGLWRKRIGRRRLLKGSALAAIGLSAAAVVGCSDEETEPASSQAPSGGATIGQPQRGGKLTILYDSSDAPHIDPQQQSFAALHDTGPAMAYSRLMTVDLSKYPEAIGFAGELAESFEVPDPQTYVFKLRKGVKFHDIPPVSGRELVAADVAFSLQRQIDEKVNRGVIAALDKVEAVDDYTVRLTLTKPDADFIYGPADLRSKVVAPEAVAVNGDLKNGPTIGTGPWILDQWTPEQTLTMKRNPSYLRQGQPYAETYERIIILDASTAQAAFRTGQALNIGTNGQLTRLLRQSVPDLQVQDAKLLQAASHRAMLLSAVQAPLTDKRARQAVSKLVDREAIIRDAMFGSGWLQVGVFVPSFDWHLPEAERNSVFARDVQGAKQLLSAAGVDISSWKPEMDLGIPTADFSAAGDIIVSNFKEAGLEISGVRQVDKVEVTERGWANAVPAVCVCNTRPSGGGTNGTLFTWFHSSGTDAGYFKQLGDKELDRMIEEQSVILNEPERRKGLLQQIMRRIVDDAVYNALPTPNGEIALAAKLQGYKHHNSEPNRFAESWLKA